MQYNPEDIAAAKEAFSLGIRQLTKLSNAMSLANVPSGEYKVTVLPDRLVIEPLSSVEPVHVVGLTPGQIAYLAGYHGYTGEEGRLAPIHRELASLQRMVQGANDRDVPTWLHALNHISSMVAKLEEDIHAQTVSRQDNRGWIIVESTENIGEDGSGLWVDTEGHEHFGPEG